MGLEPTVTGIQPRVLTCERAGEEGSRERSKEGVEPLRLSTPPVFKTGSSPLSRHAPSLPTGNRTRSFLAENQVSLPLDDREKRPAGIEPAVS